MNDREDTCQENSGSDDGDDRREKYENDDGDDRPEKYENEISFRFRGIPAGYVMRSRDAWKELGTCRNTWNGWVIQGLPVTQPGTSAEMVLTDDLIEWLRNNRNIPRATPSKSKPKGRKK